MSSQEAIEESLILNGLSDHYREVVKSYIKFTHHKTDLHLKEVCRVIQDIKDSRLLDNQYSVLEVKNIIDAVETVVKATIKSETQYASHTSIELLRQVFSEADQAGFKLRVDISSIEDEETLKELAKIENAMFPKTVPSSGNKLPSLKPVGGDDNLKLKRENDQMREQLTSLQKAYNEMMKAKTEITDNLNKTTDELTRLKNKLEGTVDLKEEQENAELKSRVEKLADQSRAQEEENNKLKSSIEALKQSFENSVTEKKEKEMVIENLKKEILTAQNELTLKVNQTSQFQNMMNIVKTKNEELKELRDRIKKLDPSFDVKE